MSTNDAYELIGGILYHTPADETNALIESENFKDAKYIADSLLAARKTKFILLILNKISIELQNYMNSPLVDLLRNYHQNTWVHYAVKLGYFNALRYLCDRDMNKQEYIRSLSVAARMGQLESVKLLHQHNTNIHVHYEPALVQACIVGHLDIVKYLVEVGADINKINKYTDTSTLEYAVQFSRIDVVKYLLEKGIKIRRKTINVALDLMTPDIIRCLVDNTADLRRSDINEILSSGSSELHEYIKAKYMI